MRAGWAWGVLGLLALGACAGAPRTRCAGAQQPAIRDELYFGTARPGGIVSGAEWAGFLADTVTPRFPQGLTVFDASGQWLGPQGSPVREAAHVLLLVHPDEPGAERRIAEIIAVYRTRFQQDAVLRIDSPVCAAYR